MNDKTEEGRCKDRRTMYRPKDVGRPLRWDEGRCTDRRTWDDRCAGTKDDNERQDGRGKIAHFIRCEERRITDRRTMYRPKDVGRPLRWDEGRCE